MKKENQQILERNNTYQKEQLEHIEAKIKKVRNFVEDRHSWFEQQTVNKVSGKKSTSKAKLKTGI